MRLARDFEDPVLPALWHVSAFDAKGDAILVQQSYCFQLNL